MGTLTLLDLEKQLLNLLNESLDSNALDLRAGAAGGATIAGITSSGTTASTAKTLLNEAAAELARTCYPVPETGTLAWAAGTRTGLLSAFTPGTTGNVLWTAHGAKWEQASGTDLVVDASNPLKVTSASYNFVSADVGKYIEVTAGSGWSLETVTITSVASNAAILSTACAATTTTGGTWNMSAGPLIWCERSAVDRATYGTLPVTSTPLYWYRDGEMSVGVHPRPSAAGVLKVGGYAVPAPMADASLTLAWIPDDLTRLLVWYAAAKVALKNLEDQSLAMRAPEWQGLYDQGRMDLWSKIDARIKKAHYPSAPVMSK